MPLTIGSNHNVVVGISPERKIDGTEHVLRALAEIASKILNVGGLLAQLRREVRTLRG